MWNSGYQFLADTPKFKNKNHKLTKVLIKGHLWNRLRNSKTSSKNLSDPSPLSLKAAEVGEAEGRGENFSEFVSAAENDPI